MSGAEMRRRCLHLILENLADGLDGVKNRFRRREALNI